MRTLSPVLCVDLGTSNTTALLRLPDGRVATVVVDGVEMTPSGVFYSQEDDTLHVGLSATRSAGLSPGHFEPHPKMHLGDETVYLGRAFPVVELLAATLRHMAAEAHRMAGIQVVDLVLTHPAAWTAYKLEKLREVAGLAGFTNVELVSEPVAATRYFAVHAADAVHNGRVAVVDLGGGTVDVTIVHITTTGACNILAENGLSTGGRMIDAALFDFIGAACARLNAEVWHRLAKGDDLGSRRDRWLLMDDLRRAKEQLGQVPACQIRLPHFEDYRITRDEVESCAEPVMTSVVACVRRAVATAGISPTDLKSIYLVGGASRMPLVATRVWQAFGIRPVLADRPEFAVVAGAMQIVLDRPEPASSLAPELGEDERPANSGETLGLLPAAGIAVRPRDRAPAAEPPSDSQARRDRRVGRVRKGARVALVVVLLLSLAGFGAYRWANRDTSGDPTTAESPSVPPDFITLDEVNDVVALDYSDDGTTIASLDGDGVVRMSDNWGGKLWETASLGGDVKWLTYEGAYVVVSSPSRMQVIIAETGKVVPQAAPAIIGQATYCAGLHRYVVLNGGRVAFIQMDENGQLSVDSGKSITGSTKPVVVAACDSAAQYFGVAQANIISVYRLDQTGTRDAVVEVTLPAGVSVLSMALGQNDAGLTFAAALGSDHKLYKRVLAESDLSVLAFDPNDQPVNMVAGTATLVVCSNRRVSVIDVASWTRKSEVQKIGGDDAPVATITSDDAYVTVGTKLFEATQYRQQ